MAASKNSLKKQTGLAFCQACKTGNNCLNFGGLAIVTDFSVLDPWLCVVGFHRFCLFVSFIVTSYHFPKKILYPYKTDKKSWRNYPVSGMI